ncbi:beta-galactosidase [Clostridium sp. 19966]|uniref:glycoside hydrolase family 35 protein n=1 Tax=Clostridium sp. 19966 TaxID=2768166 RepID=UPI0028DDE1D2|nr:beta-galactosidase [Clostridium sp. 19966]MDT8715960.1 beta-galactosidase [Clostridium sp. 19966]
MENKVFEIRDNFYLDGKEVKIISGSIHYFRVVPEYWRDRLQKLKAMGCNTVETYVPWNMHEPHKGKFQFEGITDLRGFIELAQELGLWVIVRPSPFICGEWEFGGLPAWLLADDGMRVRSNYEPFLRHVDEYYEKLFKILTPLQINYGGPIIMMQIENEYGYYGNDKKYLSNLREVMKKYGAVVPFVTSDGTWNEALESGMFNNSDVLATANFGSKAEEHFEKLQAAIGNKPLMCMEFWDGWFTPWGGNAGKRDAKETAEELDKILSRGHVNFYMFHGGTNFGFMNGANYYDKLEPDVTSYDYDSPLSESGDITPKYEECRKVISKYADIPKVRLSAQISKLAYGKIRVNQKVALFNTLHTISSKQYCDYTLPMEKLGQNYGYILYHSNVGRGRKVEDFKILGANDRAKVYVNEKEVFTQYDLELGKSAEIIFDKEENNLLDILVENMGRVNFGEKLNAQRKGISYGVEIDKHAHAGWEHYTLPLDNINQVDFNLGYKTGVPAFYKFELEVENLGDTFLKLDGWGKGCVFINDFNIGRFWEIGPQNTLYIPAPLLKKGKNEIVIFETEGKASDFIELVDKADLGK